MASQPTEVPPTRPLNWFKVVCLVLSTSATVTLSVVAVLTLLR